MIRNPETWTTTISALLLTFRDALVAITPYMDNAKIGWRDKDAYDDWDDIASTLYRNIVEKSIQNAIEVSADIQLASYDLLLNSYAGCNYIAVVRNDSEVQSRAFVGFSTSAQPFDTVKCVAINCDKLDDQSVLYVPVDECEFVAVLGKYNGELSRIVSVTIEI